MMETFGPHIPPDHKRNQAGGTYDDTGEIGPPFEHPGSIAKNADGVKPYFEADQT